MPIVEIESVISVSSEHPSYPAKNLLTSVHGPNVMKWISKNKGEKNLSVVFKLKEKTNITNIAIGNSDTAIIEILVGNDGTHENDYQVLLPTTEMESVQNVRARRIRNGIYFFSTKDFRSDVASRLWERLKVVCNQPYDSHIQFGLTCFMVKSIKDEDNDEVVAQDVNTVTPKIEIDLADTKQEIDSWKDSMLQRLMPSTSTSSVDNNVGPSTSVDKVKQELTGVVKAGDKIRNEKVKKEEQAPDPPKKEFSKILEGVKFSMSGYENPLRSDLRNKAQEMGARYFVNWNMGCTHLICAFLNTPKYKEVKTLCSGKIVIKNWIEECYRKRRRLPWRRFALENDERKLPISEEDEEEDSKKDQPKKPKNDLSRRKRLPSSSSSDTEDEVQRIQAKNARKTRKNGNTKKKPDLKDLYNADTDEGSSDKSNLSSMFEDNTDSDENYVPEDEESSPEKKGKKQKRKIEDSTDDDDDTDYEDEEYSTEEITPKKKKGKLQNTSKIKKHGRRPDTSDIPLPCLPDVSTHNYFIAKDEAGEYRNQIERYLYALNGTICDELTNEVEFAITDELEIAKQINSKFPKVRAVKSDWIWKCSNENSLVSPNEYSWK